MLRALHERKYRRQTGLFLAEGMRHCTEALSVGFSPMRLVYAAGREADKGMPALIGACQAAGGRVLPVTANLLSRISGKDNPQTVISAFPIRYQELSNIAPEGIWVALDRVRDPGNLGTIMRTAARSAMSVSACRRSSGLDSFSIRSRSRVAKVRTSC